MKTELIIFIGIFLFLAIGMHFEEFTSFPIEHITNLPHAGAYGFGPAHPIIFTLIVYIIIWIPRFVAKLFTKKKEK
jgi:hypothetical protein